MFKFKKLVLIVAIIALIAGILSGCSGKIGESNNSSNNPAKYPLKIKDFTGTEITIEKKPESIVSLTLGSDEILLSLADKSRIKALSGKISEDPGISNVAEIAKDFDKAENNIEKIIELKPDVVFAADWMKKEKIQQLRDAKIPVYCYETAGTIAAQEKVIKDFGYIIGEDNKATEIINNMEKRLTAVKEKLSSVKEENKLTVLTYNSSNLTDGKGSMFDDIASLAGLINLPGKAGFKSSDQISKEKIIELNPDIIILPSWSYDKNENLNTFADQIKSDKSLASVNAIKNNRVYMLSDKHLVTVSQYVIYGVEDLSKVAYPDLFK